MVYLKAEDEFYYTKEGKEELKKRYNLHTDLVFARDKETILNAFDDGTINNKTFIAPYMPEQISPAFSGIFDLIRVENKFGLLTKRQKEDNVNPINVLKEKLGANVYSPTITFKDYIIDKDTKIFKSMMEKLTLLKTRKGFGLESKGFFLTGVPGTGKTFFAKCVAGELNRMLIELNLSFFINNEDTFGLLNRFFSFFKYSDGEYVLLIDEIEKMFNDSPKARQVLGYLLTVLNEFSNRQVGGERKGADILFIATANNVTELVKRNPELFRKGRFDLSIYLTAPSEKKAKDTYKSYIEKSQNLFKKESIPMIFYMIAIDPSHSVYTIKENSRISQIIEKIKNNDCIMGHITNFLKDDSQKKEPNCFSKKDIYKYLTSFPEVKDFVAQIEKEFEFNIDIDLLVEFGLACYRNRSNDRSQYPYVPAEIASMVEELFSDYYFEEIVERINFEKYTRANIPLQISMSAGILEMNGATQNFLKMW